MEVPFKHPNCLGSILSLISLINHSATNSSSTLSRHGVKEIGLKSDSLQAVSLWGSVRCGMLSRLKVLFQ